MLFWKKGFAETPVTGSNYCLLKMSSSIPLAVARMQHMTAAHAEDALKCLFLLLILLFKKKNWAVKYAVQEGQVSRVNIADCTAWWRSVLNEVRPLVLCRYLVTILSRASLLSTTVLEVQQMHIPLKDKSIYPGSCYFCVKLYFTYYCIRVRLCTFSGSLSKAE